MKSASSLRPVSSALEPLRVNRWQPELLVAVLTLMFGPGLDRGRQRPTDSVPSGGASPERWASRWSSAATPFRRRRLERRRAQRPAGGLSIRGQDRLVSEHRLGRQPGLHDLRQPAGRRHGYLPLVRGLRAPAPWVCDYDNDGKRDLLVGDGASGYVYFCRNTNTDANPILDTGVRLVAGGNPLTVAPARPLTFTIGMEMD